MPGIFGLIITDPRIENGQSLFSTMEKVLLHKPWYLSESYLDENVFLGNISVRSPYRIETITLHGNEYTILIDGHVYSVNDDDHNRETMATWTIPERIVRLYVSQGRSGLQKVAGNYSIAIYKKTEDELVIFNDIIGPRRLYYGHFPGMLVFSPEIKAISFLPDFDTRLNWKGIADFLNYGYVLGGDTFFESVRSFPSAGILSIKIKSDRVTLDKYYHPLYLTRDDGFQACVDEGLEKLTASISEKVCDGDLVVSPISGGLDSRIILGVLTSLGREITVKPVTYGQTFSLEYKYARNVCDALGLASHTLVEMNPDNLLDKYAQAVWLSEGMIPLTNAHLLLIPDMIGRHHDALLNGIYGGPTNYSAEYYTHRHLEDGWDLDKKALDIKNTIAIAPGSYKGIFTEKSLEDVSHYALPSILDEFRNHLCVSDMFCNQRDAFFIDNRMRHSICQSALYRFFWEMKLPLSNYSLYEFYLKTPPRYKLERRLLKAMLLKHFPKMAGIKDANTSLRMNELPGTWFRIRRKIVSDIKYYVTRVSQGRLSFYDRSTYAHYPIWFRRNKETQSFYMARLLSHGILDSGLLDPQKVHELMNKASSGGVGFDHLCRLTTFAIWFSLFILREGTDHVRMTMLHDQ